MTSDNIRISRRSVLAGLGAIGVASAGAGLGTTAFFSDEEAVAASLQAGRLDLLVDYRATYNPWLSAEEVNARGLIGDFTARDIPGSDSVLVSEAPPLSTTEDTDDEDGIVPGADGPALGNQAWADFTRDYDACLNEDELAYVDGDSEIMFTLRDVKPKDEGEATISLHLCDNPAYLWTQFTCENDADGGIVEPEESAGDTGEGAFADGELDDYIYVEMWYDTDCDNIHDDGTGDDAEELFIYQGSLAGLKAVAGDGLALSPQGDVQIGEPVGDDDNGPEDSPSVSGVIDANNLYIQEIVVTGDDDRFEDGPGGGAPRNYQCADYSEKLGVTDIEGTEVINPDDGAIEVDAEYPSCATITVDGYPDADVENENDETGDITLSSGGPVKIVSVKGGPNGEQVYVFSEPVILDGATFTTPGDHGISNIDVCCPADDGNGGVPPQGDPSLCYDPGVYCVAFRWYLPCFVEQEDGMGFGQLPSATDADNMADELVEKFGLDSTDDIDVNVVQTDTIDFGLTFAATQCRHNMTNANPFGGASTPE